MRLERIALRQENCAMRIQLNDTIQAVRFLLYFRLGLSNPK